MVAGLFAGLVECLYILLADLDELLIHLVVLLSDEFENAHRSPHFLADLVEVHAFASCLDIRRLDVLLVQLSS